MATVNVIGSEKPIEVAKGGTGAATFGDGFLLLGSGTGAVTALDVTAKGSLVAGDGATDPIALALGTNDYVLTADSGEASGMKWAVSSGGGGAEWTAITTVTMDSSDDYYVTTGLGTAYDEYMCVFRGIDSRSNIYLSDDAGSSYTTLNFLGVRAKTIDTVEQFKTNPLTNFSTFTVPTNSFFTFNLNKRSSYKPFSSAGYRTDGTIAGFVTGVINSLLDIDAIRFNFYPSYNTTGTINIYGR